jgi:hypothetical protein
MMDTLNAMRTTPVRVSREISYGNIPNAVVIAATVLVFVVRQEGRNDVQDVRLSGIEQRFDSDVVDIRAALERIETKLDQKADKKYRPRRPSLIYRNISKKETIDDKRVGSASRRLRGGASGPRRRALGLVQGSRGVHAREMGRRRRAGHREDRERRRRGGQEMRSALIVAALAAVAAAAAACGLVNAALPKF